MKVVIWNQFTGVRWYINCAECNSVILNDKVRGAWHPSGNDCQWAGKSFGKFEVELKEKG